MAKRMLWHDYLLDDVLEAQKPEKPPGPLKGWKPGQPLPKWWGKRLSEISNEAKRKKRERKQERALAEAVERQKVRGARYHTRAPHRIVDKIMRLMEPGEWYGLKALSRAAGMGANEAGRVSQVLRKNAWATRARNPQWDPAPVEPLAIMGGVEREPEWLYRLTEAGEKEKERVAALARSNSPDEQEI